MVLILIAGAGSRRQAPGHAVDKCVGEGPMNWSSLDAGNGLQADLVAGLHGKASRALLLKMTTGVDAW
jgi:hypothetical protein